MIELVSSVNLSYWNRCGRALVESFERFVSPEIPMRLYCDGSLEGIPLEQYDESSLRVQTIDLGSLPGVREYIGDAVGRMGQSWSADPSERLTTRGYNYRRDAVTFGKKGLATSYALSSSTARMLFWVDADTVFRRHVSAALLSSLLDSADVAYFGRRKPHTETGFIGFRLENLREFTMAYTSCWLGRGIFDLPGWTDSDAFDWSLAQCRDLRLKNLSTQPEGHVVAASPLGVYIEHRKGPRKLVA